MMNAEEYYSDINYNVIVLCHPTVVFHFFTFFFLILSSVLFRLRYNNNNLRYTVCIVQCTVHIIRVQNGCIILWSCKASLRCMKHEKIVQCRRPLSLYAETNCFGREIIFRHILGIVVDDVWP